jgi:hypothetical protein
MHATASEVKPQIGIQMLPNEWLVGQDPHRPRSIVHHFVSIHTPLPTSRERTGDHHGNSARNRR